MTASQRTHGPIALVALVVAGLAVANGYVTPEKIRYWLIPVGFMASFWLVVALRQRAKPDQSEAERGLLVLSVIVAGLMLAGALGVSLAKALGYGDSTVVERGLGIAFGLAMMAMGNLMPKAVASLTATRCSPATTQSIQRFAGWTFVLAGIGYAGTWIILVPDLAEVVATAICLGAVVLVIGRIAWAYTRRRP